MSGWDFDSKSEGGKKAEFTSFPEGITRIRVIDDEPNVRWTHWMPQFKRSVNCPGRGCPICEIRKQQKANKETPTYSMNRRLAMNVLNRETGKQEIMEQGIGFFEDLRDLMSDLKADGLTLKDADIKVRRRGTGKDNTSYRLDIDEKSPLTPEDVNKANEKINLDEFFKPHDPAQVLQLLQPGAKWEEVMYNKETESEEEIEIR